MRLNMNPPTIALCDTDSPLCSVDPAIPCDKGAHSVGLTWWVLAREVLPIHDTISCEHPLKVTSDLCVSKNPEETDKEKQEAAEKAQQMYAVTKGLRR